MEEEMTREERLSAISSAINALPASMSRAEYEAFCAAASVAPLADAKIGQGGFRHAEYSLSDDPTGAARIRQVASERRLNGLNAERKQQSAPALVSCPNCGSRVARGSLMSASTGAGCPNCYDSLS
jgi:hypothetical protein